MTARLATCSRCRRPRRQVAKVMPDGPLCAHCRSESIRYRGRCAGCSQIRLLPGVSGVGGRLCCGCAGIDEDYTCKRCGTEWALRHGLCEWCHLGDTLDALLDGNVDLSGLRARLTSVARPDSIIIWLYQPHARELLHGLAVGTVPLTHHALDDYPHRGAANHLRALLVAIGLIPERDEHLTRYDRWVAEHLAEWATTGDDLKILQQFATWGLRHHLVTQSQQAPLRDAQIDNATQKLRVAAALLTWLGERGRALSTCTQADLDEWFTTPPTTRAHASTFVRWALSNRRLPKLRMPARRRGTAPVLDQCQRLDTLRKLLDPATGRLEHRVAAMLLVLLGQPMNKISTLTVDDIVIDGATIGVRLGQGVTPIPEPFAAMVRDLRSHRPNINTATNPTSAWLFPGQKANSHLTPATLTRRAIGMGINLVAARSGALRQLVLECPPPVVADALGYSYQTIDRHALQAGSPWSSYAALRARAPSESIGSSGSV